MNNWPTSFKAWILVLSRGLSIIIGYASFSAALVFAVCNGVLGVLNHPRLTPLTDFPLMKSDDFIQMFGFNAVLALFVLVILSWPPRQTKTQDAVVHASR